MKQNFLMMKVLLQIEVDRTAKVIEVMSGPARYVPTCRFGPFRRIWPKKTQGVTGEEMPVQHDRRKAVSASRDITFEQGTPRVRLLEGRLCFLKGKKS